jgi:hypothetical protein
MRYLLLIYSSEQPGGGPDLSKRNFAPHRALISEARSQGIFVAAEPLAPVSASTTVRSGPGAR